MMSSSNWSQIKTMWLSFPFWIAINFPADVCYNYSILNDSNRKSSYPTNVGDELCDNLLPEGWYRFEGAAGTKMPTTHIFVSVFPPCPSLSLSLPSLSIDCLCVFLPVCLIFCISILFVCLFFHLFNDKKFAGSRRSPNCVLFLLGKEIAKLVEIYLLSF